MIRTIIQIDETLCDGCGLCVSACHEGALGLVGGKAKLLRDDYCDGMGDCLPACPAGAITFIEREAAAYDEAAVAASMEARKNAAASAGCEGGCAANLEALVEKLSSFLEEPLDRAQANTPASDAAGKGFAASAGAGFAGQGTAMSAGSGAVSEGAKSAAAGADTSANTIADTRVDASADTRASSPRSALTNWPVQIKLAPPVAPYFAGADLLIAADCTAFAHGDFHARFMSGRVALIGCPKLDAIDYAEKLTAIIASNDVRSVTVARMQVPCCGGIENAARRALVASGKDLPLEVVTISTNGEVLGV